MFIAAAIIIIYHFVSTMAFCHMHAASQTQKYMMLHSQPNTKILVNHMIDKYSKTSGVPSFYIKDCIESKKKVIKPKPKPSLRGKKN